MDEMERKSNKELSLLFLEHLENLIGQKRFDEWFRDHTGVLIEQNVITIGVNNLYLLKWLQNAFKSHCDQVAIQLLGPAAKVDFIVASSAIKPTPQTGKEKTKPDSNKTKRDLQERKQLHDADDGRSQFISANEMMPVKEARESKDDSAGVFSSSHVSSDMPGKSRKSKESSENTSHLGNIPENNGAEVEKLQPLRSKGPAKTSPRKFKTLDSFMFNPDQMELKQAILDICSAPCGTISPLYIYGGVGNGKTHILESMNTELRAPGRNLRVVCLSAEQFSNLYTHALRSKSVPSFHQKLRNLDVLIVDDVEFLDGKNGLQEEFLRTLKSLEFYHKQLVFTSDRHPRSFEHTRVEIIDRYCAGLVKKLDAPTEEIRVGIVKQRAGFLKLKINHNVVKYIANKFKGSVRELVGAVNSLHSVQRVTEGEITLQRAKEILAELEKACYRIIRLSDIEEAVCKMFNIDLADLRSSTRTRSISTPRMIAMFLMRKMTNAAYSEIGRQLGGRNHSTVLAAQKKVSNWIATESKIKIGQDEMKVQEIVSSIEENLQAI